MTESSVDYLALHMLAVWALPRPTYVGALLGALDHYANFLVSEPALVVGDFSSDRRWDKKHPNANHTSLEERLGREFGLVNAFRAFAERSGSTAEPPTHYWRWKEGQGYHLDYCFIPKAWGMRLREVEIGNYSDWAEESDHCPLVVEIDGIE